MSYTCEHCGQVFESRSNASMHSCSYFDLKRYSEYELQEILKEYVKKDEVLALCYHGKKPYPENHPLEYDNWCIKCVFYQYDKPALYGGERICKVAALGGVPK